MQTLAQKLLEIRKQIPYLQKTKDGFKGKYVPGSSILAAIRPLADSLGVLFHCSIVEHSVTNIEIKPSPAIEKFLTDEVLAKLSPAGVEVLRKFVAAEGSRHQFLVNCKIKWEIINVDDPTDKIELFWVAIASDVLAFVAFGKAWTYALRYFLLYALFCVPTDEIDPEIFLDQEKEEEPRQPQTQQKGDSSGSQESEKQKPAQPPKIYNTWQGVLARAIQQMRIKQNLLCIIAKCLGVSFKENETLAAQTVHKYFDDILNIQKAAATDAANIFNFPYWSEIFECFSLPTLLALNWPKTPPPNISWDETIKLLAKKDWEHCPSYPLILALPLPEAIKKRIPGEFGSLTDGQSLMEKNSVQWTLGNGIAQTGSIALLQYFANMADEPMLSAFAKTILKGHV